MFFHLAERRIEQAVRDGLLDDLPGKGRPLQIDLHHDVPEDLRAGYSVLAAQGFVPESLQRRRHRLRLEQLLAACRDEHEARQLSRRLRAARLLEQLELDRELGRL